MKEALNSTKMNVGSIHSSLMLSLTRLPKYKDGEKRHDFLGFGRRKKKQISGNGNVSLDVFGRHIGFSHFLF